MLFNKRAFDASEAINEGESPFKQLVEESTALFKTSFLGVLIPWLNWLDVQGARKRMDRVAKGLDTFLEKELAERIVAKEEFSKMKTT
ncbi:hypothetical protein L7F22_059467 [Adiantum nelumboides]|nr:hypothetical protein [Adiantum nelumboides]